MKKIIERLLEALVLTTVLCAILTMLMCVYGIVLCLKDDIRKDQERTICNKLGGRYTYLEECLAVDGKAFVIPIKR